MSETKPAESNLPTSKVQYSFNEATREISRKDQNGSQVLATLIDGVIEYESDKAKNYHTVVIRFLNDEGLKFESFFVKGQPRDNVKASDIPPPPKKDRRFGDKTPAYVEWMKKYKPAEYNARYGIIGMGSVTKVEHGKNAQGRPTVRRYKQDGVVLARRKTHLTELRDAGDTEETE